MVTERTLLTDQMNFDLCDLEKVKSKTWVICHVSYGKNLEMPLVQEL
jgi:hypothetical protein